MNAFLVATSAVTLLSFLAAFVILETMPLREEGYGRGGFKLVMGSAMAIFAFVGLSHLLQRTGVTPALDVYENYVKVMFIPIVTIGTLAGRVDEELSRARAQARVLAAEHEMLMGIVDTTLTGIAVLDATGHIEFVNERGRALLTLAEDPHTGRYQPPSWILTCPDVPEPMRDFAMFVGEKPVRDAECTLRWPDGRSVPLTVSATPIKVPDGTVTGAVLAFSGRTPAPAS